MEKNYVVGKDISKDLGYDLKSKINQPLGSRRSYSPKFVSDGDFNKIVLGNQNVYSRNGKPKLGLDSVIRTAGAIALSAGMLFGTYSALTRDNSSQYSSLEQFAKNVSLHVSPANPENDTPFTGYVSSSKMDYINKELTQLGHSVKYTPATGTILVDVNKDGIFNNYKDLAFLSTKF